MLDHPVRFDLTIEAASLDDVADRLMDIATDIARGQSSPQSAFAGGSSRGHYELTARDDSGRRPNDGE